jgi:acetylornithine/succinyldiaminopimelate/putrescine aminotransferase
VIEDPIARQVLEHVDAHLGDGESLHRDYVNPGFVKLMGLGGFGRRYVSATGCTMVDDAGRPYLDFVSGYGVLNLGHNHPGVRATLQAILDRELPSFSQVECGALPGLAAERLCGQLPGDLRRVFFCNSGSEAVDSSVKLARAATGKKRIIACNGGYHGSMLGVLGLTDNPQRRDAHRPLLPGIVHVPFGDLDSLREALAGKDVAALVVEPVQGEGGVVVPPPEFLPAALDACHRHGALLVVDEVQTGLGRTGSMFAIGHSGVVPDILACAKALGGGLVPVGAMVAKTAVFEKAYGSLRTCLDHRSTFGGGPLAMAAILATLEILEREDLVTAARETGAYAKTALQGLVSRHERVEEVRGLGLMLGIKLRPPSLPGLAKLAEAAATLYAQYVAIRLIEDHGIITQVAANDLTVLKVMPPLCIDRPAIDRLAGALDTVLGDKGMLGALVDLAKSALG